MAQMFPNQSCIFFVHNGIHHQLYHDTAPICIDSQIRADLLVRANRLRVPELHPLVRESRFWGTKRLRIAGFEAIRAQSLRPYDNSFFLNVCSFEAANRFARINSRESPRFAL